MQITCIWHTWDAHLFNQNHPNRTPLRDKLAPQSSFLLEWCMLAWVCSPTPGVRQPQIYLMHMLFGVMHAHMRLIRKWLQSSKSERQIRLKSSCINNTSYANVRKWWFPWLWTLLYVDCPIIRESFSSFSILPVSWILDTTAAARKAWIAVSTSSLQSRHHRSMSTC